MDLSKGDLDNAVLTFQHAFSDSMVPLMSAAMDLAYLLAIIGLIVSCLMMMLQGEPFAKAMSKVMWIGILFGIFFTAIHLCGGWFPGWINGFIQAGGQAAGIKSLDPSSVISYGLVIASDLIKAAHKAGLWHVATALFTLIIALFVVIIYALVAADLAVVLVKSYALVAIGPIVFALGMNEITRPTVTNYIQKLVGIGINLLMLYIVIGVGINISQSWVEGIAKLANSMTFAPMFTIVAGLILFYLVVKNVPAFIATLSGATGFRNYGDAAVGAAMSASALGVRAAAAPAAMGQGAARLAGGAATAAHYGLQAAKAIGVGAMQGGGVGSMGGLKFGGGISSVVEKSANFVGLKAVAGAFNKDSVAHNTLSGLSAGVGGVAGGVVGTFAVPAGKMAAKMGQTAFNRVVQGPPKKPRMDIAGFNQAVRGMQQTNTSRKDQDSE